MRFLTATVESETGGIHPVDVALAKHPDLIRVQLLHINSLFDGRGVMLYHLDGPADAIPELLDGCPSVVDYDVLDGSDDGFHIYIHVEAGEPAGALMHLVEQHGLIVDTPIDYTLDGLLRATVVGTEDMIRRGLADVPDTVELTVEQVGRYAPNHEGVLSSLTSRQRRVLRTAVESGYYDVPRRTTQKELAAELSCSTSTVDEHLRKIESKLFSKLVV